MSILLTALADTCHLNKFCKKLLVMPSLAAGHQLIESLSRSGSPWINLQPVTPLMLAREAADPALEARGRHWVSGGRILYLLEEVLAEMASRERLAYFAPLRGLEGLGAVFRGTVAELRMAGVKAADLDPAAFVDPQKGGEIKDLLTGYEAKLEQYNLVDAAAVYQTARDGLRGGQRSLEGTIFIIPEQAEMEPLEFAFMDEFTAGRRVVLPAEPLHNLAKTEGFYFRSAGETAAVSPLSWLYRVEDAPGGRQAGLEIFRAYGAANEVREVLRRLKSAQISLDEALVCYTGGSEYAPLFFTAAAALNLPVTFGEGIPLSSTRPGRAALALIRWVEENYSAPLFYRLLTSGDLIIKQAPALAGLLRKASIGWGRERYLPCLEEQEASLARGVESALRGGDEGTAAYLKERQEQNRRLREIVTDILEQLPSPNGEGLVNFEQVCLGFQALALRYARVGGDQIDRAAFASLQEELAEAAQSCPGLLVEKEALQRLRLRLERLTAGAAGPKPGHLHVTGFRGGEAVQRPHTFMVGLEAGAFQGKGLQDPLLLDGERKKISSRLALCSETHERNLYRMARFLASRRGRLYLSFPCYDVAQGRDAFPAALLLQVYRLQQGDPEADYTDLVENIADPAGYLPPQPSSSLTVDEWWLSTALYDTTMRAERDSVNDCYPGLAAGRKAQTAREGPAFSAFDGKVSVDPSLLDPRQNSALYCSVTQLENLAHCPFAYFLQYVLWIRPPEEYEFDPGVWLDHLTRGSLLHEIYCRYLRESYDPGQAAPPGKKRLLEIAAMLIEDTRRKLPPPSELVFEAERDDLLRGLEVFLLMEDKEKTKVKRVFFEVPFGLGAAAVGPAGLGLAEPVELPLPGGGSVRLRGRIDRIDHVELNRYAVWDYKTGGAYGFRDNEFLKQGRQLQHALYARAAEEILRSSGTDREAEVQVAGYIFPTEKGEGVRQVRRQDQREPVYKALVNILDLLAAGTFCPSSDGDRCRYCDYKIVCRSPDVVEWVKLKLECPANRELEPWKELQGYA